MLRIHGVPSAWNEEIAMNPIAPIEVATSRTARALRPLRVIAAGLALVFAVAAQPAVSQAIEHEASFYQLGVAVGRSLTEFQLSEEELAIVQKGLLAVVHGETVPEPSEEDMKRLSELRNKRVAAINASLLAKLKNEEGARVQESGLIYFELEGGSGPRPGASDTVKVHYHGTLANGAVFDSSVVRGEPAEFPLNRVIACWTEGVGMMKLGGKSKLVCPPGIAYGDRGAPPTIPGGAVLTFEVELLEIKPVPAVSE